MLRKIFSTTLLAVLVLLTACGNKLPEIGADTTVKAYAQLYTCGVIDDVLKSSVHLTETDIEKARERIKAPLWKFLEQYPLSEETLQTVTKKFFRRLRNIMDIHVMLKKGDPEHPVVELIATSINPEGVNSIAEDNDKLNDFHATIAELKAQGFTDEQLKQNPEVQKLALDAISSFVADFTLNEKATILVPCKIVTGEDGKLYWTPENAEAIAQHITGQP